MHKHLTRLATGLALLTALAAQAQVGLATLPVQGRPLTLVYPTISTARPVDVGPFRLAGAQWNTLGLVRHCGAHLDEDPGFCLQGAVTPEQKAERTKRFDAARGVPDAYLPADLRALHGGCTPGADQADPRPDPRIAAVTLAVPVAAVFTPESLAHIRVPVGIVAAQNDRVLLPRYHSAYVLAQCSSCRLLTELPGAGHFDLLRPWPESVAHEVAAAQVRGGEVTPGLNPALLTQAHDRIVAFHRQHLMTQP